MTSGTSVRPLRVALPSAPPLHVELTNAAAELTVTPGGADVEVRTTGSLRLVGTAPLRGVFWSLAGPIDFADGGLRLAAGAELPAQEVHWDGDQWRAVVVLEDEPAGRLALELGLPCELLTPMRFRRPRELLPDDGAVDLHTPRVRPLHAKLTLSATPGGPPGRVLAVAGSAQVVLDVLEAAGEYRRVRLQNPRMFRLEGWVRKDQVESIVSGSQYPPSGRPRPSPSWVQPPVPAPQRPVPARPTTVRLPVGAHVFHAEAGQPFAEVSASGGQGASGIDIVVDFKATASWLRVIELPGVWAPEMWVRRMDLALHGSNSQGPEL